MAAMLSSSVCLPLGDRVDRILGGIPQTSALVTNHLSQKGQTNLAKFMLFDIARYRLTNPKELVIMLRASLSMPLHSAAIFLYFFLSMVSL